MKNNQSKIRAVILDTGTGNAKSVHNSFSLVSNLVKLSANLSVLEESTHLIVPGVGSFGSLMSVLTEKKLIIPITKFINSGKHFLGICLGMQILYDGSDESQDIRGLGIFSGKVKKFSPDVNTKSTHNGWNEIQIMPNKNNHLSLKTGNTYYFNHGYYAPGGGSEVYAQSANGIPFAAAVNKLNVYGVQFHPEKSQQSGFELISKFLNL
jgi:imidazole glycerol phosphate synthase glutamine amidotransferase subunit